MIKPNLSVACQALPPPCACCNGAVPTLSDAARDIGAVAPCDEEVARPDFSVAVGGLRSGDRDRLSFLPRRGMAEKNGSRNYTCVKFCGQLIPATYAQVSTG